MPPGGVSITATQRLRKDFTRLMKDPVPFIVATPLPSNILQWHYVVTGPPDSPYEGGYYHGKLVFPPDFPFKPPSIYMLTPNGRFQINTRLCLSISDYHPDSWNPAWTVSTILTGLLSFMLENSPTLGSIQSSDYEKRMFVRKCKSYNLKDKNFCDLFPELAKTFREDIAKEAEELARRGVGGRGSGVGERGREGEGGETPASFLDHSVTYNLLVLCGVVFLAFAVRYVLVQSEADSSGT